MACQSSYVTVDEVGEFFCRGEGYGPDSEPSDTVIENYITKAAARINMALAANGQCDCTFNSYATEFLQELNLIGAAVLIHCPDCNRHLKVEEREFYEGWLGEQLELLRSGKLELCAGETAVDYPAGGFVQKSWTEWSESQIIYDTRRRNSSS